MRSFLFLLTLILFQISQASDPFAFLRSYYSQMLPKKEEEKKVSLSLTSKGLTPSCYNAREYRYGSGMLATEVTCSPGYQVLSGICQVYGKGEISNQYSAGDPGSTDTSYHCESISYSMSKYTLSARAWCCKFV